MYKWWYFQLLRKKKKIYIFLSKFLRLFLIHLLCSSYRIEMVCYHDEDMVAVVGLLVDRRRLFCANILKLLIPGKWRIFYFFFYNSFLVFLSWSVSSFFILLVLSFRMIWIRSPQLNFIMKMTYIRFFSEFITCNEWMELVKKRFSRLSHNFHVNKFQWRC